jgi:hypothetical protein
MEPLPESAHPGWLFPFMPQDWEHTPAAVQAYVHRPTVSPLMIPLVYCHINSFQRALSMEKPFPGGENRRNGRASHHVAL